MITLVTYKDHEEIIEVWEQSARTSQQFSTEENLQEIKSLLPSILRRVRLYAYRGTSQKIKGFIGIAGQKIEMLFVHPNHFNQQIGSQLTKFCIHSLNIDEVDVNEQNHSAINFYKKMGYRVIGREEINNYGMPSPIVHLKYSSISNSVRPVPSFPHAQYEMTH